MTFQYNSAGQVIGTTRNLADDPSLRAKLAAEEKGLLDALKNATRKKTREEILRKLRIFYVGKSLDFEKAEKLLPLLTNPDDIYNLKLDLATAPNLSAKEMNARLAKLVEEFPDRKAYTELHMIK